MTWTKIFRQEIGKLKNPRLTTQRLRAHVGDAAPRSLFQELGHVPLFRGAIAKNRAPRRFGDLWAFPRLRSHGLFADLEWTAEVMSLFAGEVSSFLSYERAFDRKYIVGDWNACLELLDELEERHGLSLWLISRRLTLLRLVDRPSEEDYVGSLIQSSPDGTVMSWLVYMMGYRADPNVTPTTYIRQVNAALSPNIEGSMRAFLFYHALNAPPGTPEDCHRVLAVSETAPLIDRYVALLDVLQSVVRSIPRMDEGRERILLAVSRLVAVIDDDRLRLLEETLNPALTSRLIQRVQPLAADAYTEGNYDEAVDRLSNEIQVSPCRTGNYSLLARTMLRTDKAPNIPASIEGTVRLMASAFVFADDDESPTTALSREALSGAHRSLASSIRALISAEDPIDTVADTVCEALNSEILTPLQLRHLPVDNREGLLNECLAAYPNSTSLKLQYAVLRFGKDELESSLQARLPTDRNILYSARSLTRLSRHGEAVELLRELENHPVAAVANDAFRELFYAFRSAGLSREALRLVARAHRRNEKLHSVFKLAPLLDEIEAAHEGPPFDEISLSICYHIHNRFAGKARMGAQADAAEEYVLSRGADLPSRISYNPSDRDAELFPTYLDQVCSPPTLDKFMAIDSVDEVELERLEICRMLAEIDSSNRQRYLDEIREITRRRVVRDRFEQVERTKIYVDTDGIKRQAEKNLRDAYLRFTVALADGTHTSERLEVMRHVQRILSEVNADGVKIHFPDLPANEADVLFDRLVHDVMRLLISSQEYGLEAYLSTRVRHGTMGNQLRSAFELQALLTQRDGGRYQPDHFWSERLNIQLEESGQWLADRLARFSEELDATIEDLVKRRVQVKSDALPEGLFRFQTFNYDTLRLQSEITPETSFDTFMDKVVDQFWTVLEHTLGVVRQYIEQDFLNSVYALTDSLERDLARELAGAVNILPIHDAIAAARTLMSVNVASVASWFTLARDMERPDYEFGIAVEVAEESIRVCHPSLGIEVVRMDDVSFECRGRTLESLVYMLFTALDNAVEHSGFNDRGPEIALHTSLIDGWLELKLTNSCASIEDIEESNGRLVALRARLQSESDVRGLATTEGGSGYAKIIRILRHDLLARHSLEFGYSSPIEYAVTIGMEAKAIVK